MRMLDLEVLAGPEAHVREWCRRALMESPDPDVRARSDRVAGLGGRGNLRMDGS
jgi:hypothetical protein